MVLIRGSKGVGAMALRYVSGMEAYRARVNGFLVPDEVSDDATLQRHDTGGWCWCWQDYNGQRICWVDVEVEE